MKVYIAKKPSRGTAGKYPEVDGVVRIDVSSGSKKKLNGINMSDLSPMKLKINGVIFENYWQYGKVYDCHVDEYGNIKDTYWTWRENGRNSNKGKRRPLPKNKTLYFLTDDGKQLNYIESRKQVYVKLYKECVEQTQAFQELKKLDSVLLIEPDGPDEIVEVTQEYLDEEIENTSHPYGHCYVLASMLL